ncbi:collagen alpha-1(I) chain-like [Sciurus carolinensis]|uniref:collagen alpha-1(I) chain-like n=1 Tax=Sciurus carolinensis TaxID=30640 RepID=UPI001FB37395|nr:collagen alpha-1(I) chain-like [Sciurus carolinensis]
MKLKESARQKVRGVRESRRRNPRAAGAPEEGADCSPRRASPPAASLGKGVPGTDLKSPVGERSARATAAASSSRKFELPQSPLTLRCGASAVGFREGSGRLGCAHPARTHVLGEPETDLGGGGGGGEGGPQSPSRGDGGRGGSSPRRAPRLPLLPRRPVEDRNYHKAPRTPLSQSCQTPAAAATAASRHQRCALSASRPLRNPAEPSSARLRPPPPQIAPSSRRSSFPFRRPELPENSTPGNSGCSALTPRLSSPDVSINLKGEREPQFAELAGRGESGGGVFRPNCSQTGGSDLEAKVPIPRAIPGARRARGCSLRPGCQTRSPGPATDGLSPGSRNRRAGKPLLSPFPEKPGRGVSAERAGIRLTAGPHARFRVPGPAGKLSRRGRPLPGWRRGAELRFTCPPYQRRRRRWRWRGGGLGGARPLPRCPRPPPPCWGLGRDHPAATIPAQADSRLARHPEAPRAPLRELCGGGSRGRVLLAAAPGTSRPPRRRRRRHGGRKPSRRPERPPLAPRAVPDEGWPHVTPAPSSPQAHCPRPGCPPFKPEHPARGPARGPSATARSTPPPPPSPAAGTGGARSRHSGRAGTPAPGPCSWARGAGRGCLLLCAEIAEEKMGLRGSGPGAAGPRPPRLPPPVDDQAQSQKACPGPGTHSLVLGFDLATARGRGRVTPISSVPGGDRAAQLTCAAGPASPPPRAALPDSPGPGPGRGRRCFASGSRAKQPARRRFSRERPQHSRREVWDAGTVRVGEGPTVRACEPRVGGTRQPGDAADLAALAGSHRTRGGPPGQCQPHCALASAGPKESVPRLGKLLGSDRAPPGSGLPSQTDRARCGPVSLRHPLPGAHGGAGIQGVKSPSSPRLLGGVEETLIKRRWPARFTRRRSARRGREEEGQGGGRRARAARQEARSRRLVTPRLGAHGCAREPGGQASAPRSRAPGASAPVPPPPPPRAPGAAGLTLRNSRSRDPLVSSRAGQKLCKPSLANRKFLIGKVLPIPHAGFKTKQNPSASGQRARPLPAGPAPLRRLGDPRLCVPRPGVESSPSPGAREQAAPAAANTQTQRTGSARAPPRVIGCYPPGPRPGRAGARGREARAFSGRDPRRAVLRSCRGSPGQRLPGGVGAGRPRGAADSANPAAGTREGCELGLAKFLWKLHVLKLQRRGGRRGPGERAGAAGTRFSLPGSREGGEARLPEPDLLCALFFLLTLREI